MLVYYNFKNTPQQRQRILIYNTSQNSPNSATIENVKLQKMCSLYLIYDHEGVFEIISKKKKTGAQLFYPSLVGNIRTIIYTE